MNDPEPLILPTLTEGAELVGEFKGSGYRQPPQLVRLPNRQLVQLPPLLFSVAKALHDHRHLAADPHAALAEVADAVTAEANARISTEQVLFLIDRKLAPLGVTTYSNGTAPSLAKADTFLALRFRTAVFPATATWFLSGLFAWLFKPAVLLPSITMVAAAEVWLVATQPMGEALNNAIRTPTSILFVLALTVLSCVFHEIGHASACRYSGVRPGVMGCGIYVVWPAFYTDITDSYRLGRGGRLRTDLGGVYFNGIFLIALAVLYALTGYDPLLVAVVAVNLEIIQQLLPTLRFDGYYIISDLVGIPDLFKYMRPILRRTLLRRPAEERLNALKRWPQIVVTVWVLTVIPALAFQLGLIAIKVPDLILANWQRAQNLALSAQAGAGPLELLAGTLQLILLTLPLLGLALLTYWMLRWLTSKIIKIPTPQQA
ncbi:hypothetical protein [Actinomadura rudentiformis]|uniref:M50 family metallopeptidase n=1 Tax=Actinomadura rudentiformis TaxID=359158 RepID=A0A6H9YEQ6_9ACTN|nr:hypothetical protein [Actinomadura rudentiformis]KAB2342184.1 hypothetical protein F8566_39690 [Actinomadura rudentiformis]